MKKNNSGLNGLLFLAGIIFVLYAMVKSGQCKQLVKRLQHLLTNSFYAKALAVKKVKSNRGKKTLGVDNIIWKSKKDKWRAIFDLEIKGYKAKPTKRVYIKKSNGKLRPLSIPTMKDRAMQTLFLLALQPIEETIGDEHSYGFRLNRGCKDAAEQLFVCLCHKNGAQWVLEGDIKGCFDNISHRWLLENIPMRKNILKEFIKAGFVFENRLFPNNKGAAQGGLCRARHKFPYDEINIMPSYMQSIQ